MEIKKIHIAIIVAILAVSIPFASVSMYYMSPGNRGTQQGPEPDPRDAMMSRIAHSDIYTLPIGGFDSSFINIPPNSSAEISYTLYSRNWGPGTVTYEINATDFSGKVSDRILNVTIEPAVFTTEPNRNYTSKIRIETGPAFGSTTQICSKAGACKVGGVTLQMNATLENQKYHLCNDTFTVFSQSNPPIPGLFITHRNSMIMETGNPELHPGETIYLNVTLYQRQGIREITYTVPDIPLNVTVVPTVFVASQMAGPYPGMIKIHADRNLPVGKYPISLNITASSGAEFPETSSLTVNVTAPSSHAGHGAISFT